MHTLKRYLYYLFVLPSTILHELLHLLPCLLFSVKDFLLNIIRNILGFGTYKTIEITNFSIIPNKKTNSLGRVEYKSNSDIQNIIISIFPITSWLFIALVFTMYNGGLSEYISSKTLDNIFNITDIFFVNIAIYSLIFYYLILAGRLSRQDMKNVISSLFSVQVFTLSIAIIFTYIIYKNYNSYIDFYINYLYISAHELYYSVKDIIKK